MAWDNQKSTNATSSVPNDEQLQAAEWNNHVADQKDHSARHENGGIDEIDVTGLSGVLADAQDPNSEQVEDIVAALIAQGSNVTVTYDDPTDTLTISSTDTNTQLSDEEVQDVVGPFVKSGTNTTVNYDDAANALTINATDTNTQLSDEEVQDIVGPFVNGGTNVSTTYDDPGDTLTIDATDTNTQLSDEQVQDVVGPFVNGGTNITANYDDAANTLTINGSVQRTSEALQVELPAGEVIAHGVPVADNEQLTVKRWGIRTDANTTPAGLDVELTEPDGTLISAENTALNTSPAVSTTNNTGSPEWYRLRLNNSTGTNFVEGNTPSSVLGSFVYEVV